MTRMTAGQIASEAARIVEGARQQQHGDKERAFDGIARLWNAYLDTRRPGPLTAVDVANLMVLLKVGRSLQGDAAHADHYVDACGYAALAGEAALRNQARLVEEADQRLQAAGLGPDVVRIPTSDGRKVYKSASLGGVLVPTDIVIDLPDGAVLLGWTPTEFTYGPEASADPTKCRTARRGPQGFDETGLRP